MDKIIRGLYIVIGFIFFALGAVGAVLPVLPTVPLLLVSAFCFAKGSERVNRWFLSTRLYRKHLDSFVKERSMLLKTKVCILVFASAMLIIAFFMMQNLFGRVFILILMVIKYYYFLFRIKTLKAAQSKKYLQ